MRTNCVNCGAAIDIDEQKCPFCGTSYFDLTDIDFTSPNPVALRMKIPYLNGGAVVTMLARPKLDEFNVKTDYVTMYEGWGISPLAYMPASNSVNVGVSFEAIMRSKSNELFCVEIDEPSFRKELD